MGIRTRTIAAQVANSFSNATNTQTLTPTANVTFESLTSNTLSVTTITSSGLTTSLNTAYSNAIAYSGNAALAYANAVAYAAANTYVNTQLGLKASLSGATFSGAVSGITTFAAGNTTITGTANVTANLTANNVRTYGSVQIDGDLTVSGNAVTINVTNLAVEDNMIYLNNGSVVTHPDLGFAGNYNDGNYRHAGVFRDATDARWKFFDGYQPEPDASAFIDTSNTTFRIADIQANTLYVANGVFTSGVSGITTLAAGNTTITGFANVSTTLQVTGAATFSANLTLGTTTITANGGVGTAGQVLTSSATGNVYWSTVATTLDAVLGIGNTTSKALTTGALTVNGAASFTNISTYTGNATFSNTVTFTSNGAIILPRGTTADRPTGAAGMIRYNNTTSRVEYWNVPTSSWVGIGEFSASGGTETTYSSYKVHTFNSSGTFTVSSGTATIDYVVVAGGGAGGCWHAGGGGAGGMLTGTMTLSQGTYSIVIGAGGAGGTTSVGNNGGDTTALGLTAVGGGRGGNYTTTLAASGGSGAGGNGYDPMNSAGSGTAGQGNPGGNGSGSHYGGGGGGKGGNGETAVNGTRAGNGGTGGSTSIRTGSPEYYAGGGGGGVWNNASYGTGGAGGGGNGSYNQNSNAPTPGASNSGGGGGGAGSQGNQTSYAAQTTGGSGIVIIRYSA